MNFQILSIILGTALSIVSITLAVRLYKRKKPTWCYVTEKIIGIGSNAPAELQLSFNGQVITDIYQTTLIFFNRGRETIQNNDITDPLVAHFVGGEILKDPTVRKTSIESIKFSTSRKAEKGEHQLLIDFLYLDYEDGGIIEVLHTKTNNILFTGNIMGADRIDNIWKLFFLKPSSRFFLGWAIAMTSSGVALMIIGEPPHTSGGTFVIMPSFFIGIALLIAGTTAIAYTIKSRLHIRGFPRWCINFFETAKRGIPVRSFL